MKKFIILIFGILIFLPGCVYAANVDGPYDGKVIDADAREPLEGVVILGVWYTSQFSPAGATHNYYDAMETVTDKNGKFSTPGLGLRQDWPGRIFRKAAPNKSLEPNASSRGVRSIPAFFLLVIIKVQG